MDKRMNSKEFLATICSLQGHVMASFRLQCKIWAKMENRKFDAVLKEASAEAAAMTKKIFSMLPDYNEPDNLN